MFVSTNSNLIASLAVCLLKNEPKKEVVHNNIKFSPDDIKGLLVKAVTSLPFTYDWVGFRYPEKSRDLRDPAQDPVPSKLFMKLKEWKQSGKNIPIIAGKFKLIISIISNLYCYFLESYINQIMKMLVCILIF